MMSNVERVFSNSDLLAMIIRYEFCEQGIHFFTDNALSQQLAFMQQEVLFIRKGRLRVDFYDADQRYLESRILHPGDVILLIQGGHGFEVLEEVEMIEVKQGPYVGERDKTRFAGIEQSQVKLPK